jgi:hypothetical protein
MCRMTLSGMEHGKAPYWSHRTQSHQAGQMTSQEKNATALGQRVSDSYIVDIAYQRMSSKYAGKTS